MTHKITFAEATARFTKDEFHNARGRAIQEYAELEQALCSLFACLSDIKPDTVGIIFFRITNSRVRDVILEKLLKKKHGNTYSIFWNSFIKLIDQISRRRNEIVHWNALMTFGSEYFISLRPPNFWAWEVGTPEIKTDGLLEFIDKCKFFTSLCNSFEAFITPEIRERSDQGQVQTWHDIFQQETIYPPLNTHPLSPNYTAPGIQPPASPASP
jgi:hypothetical protein